MIVGMENSEMDTFDFIEDINLRVERFINKNMEQITPARDNIGLDNRSAYTLYISQDAIAVDKHQDRNLQYYGGFEYVDKEYRRELGDYVFYLGEDDRVRGHIDRYYDREEEEEA